ncbi:transcriptional repressor LexA [Thioalkalivibrio sp. ALMg11]|uniref:transcriptional repressor LexA n=1 Tax=Thioalkalivibrio sp. ALMg11 TaxID=1158165 RepID=UPI00036C98C7|nr:transcriptional repressor LexA [Thioalkalivibrio sp. ALMg11]
MEALTPHQRRVLESLQRFAAEGHAPSLDELAQALGLRSRGSLHKHIRALEAAGYVQATRGRHRGVRLADDVLDSSVAEGTTGPGSWGSSTLPLLGRIAAGQPIEALAHPEPVEVPPALRGHGECYVLEVKGDSMQDAGILDGDWVVIESRNHARNGEIVVALINGEDVTLKRIEQTPSGVRLHSENPAYPSIHVAKTQLQIQGVLVGQMRRYQSLLSPK